MFKPDALCGTDMKVGPLITVTSYNVNYLL